MMGFGWLSETTTWCERMQLKMADILIPAGNASSEVKNAHVEIADVSPIQLF